MQKTNN